MISWKLDFDMEEELITTRSPRTTIPTTMIPTTQSPNINNGGSTVSRLPNKLSTNLDFETNFVHTESNTMSAPTSTQPVFTTTELSNKLTSPSPNEDKIDSQTVETTSFTISTTESSTMEAMDITKAAPTETSTTTTEATTIESKATEPTTTTVEVTHKEVPTEASTSTTTTTTTEAPPTKGIPFETTATAAASSTETTSNEITSAMSSTEPIIGESSTIKMPEPVATEASATEAPTTKGFPFEATSTSVEATTTAAASITETTHSNEMTSTFSSTEPIITESTTVKMPEPSATDTSVTEAPTTKAFPHEAISTTTAEAVTSTAPVTMSTMPTTGPSSVSATNPSILDEIASKCNATVQESANKDEPTPIKIDRSDNDLPSENSASTTPNASGETIEKIATTTQRNALDQIAEHCKEEAEETKDKSETSTSQPVEAQTPNENVAVTPTASQNQETLASDAIKKHKEETVEGTTSQPVEVQSQNENVLAMTTAPPSQETQTSSVIKEMAGESNTIPVDEAAKEGNQGVATISPSDETSTIDPENNSWIFSGSINVIIPLLFVVFITSNFN